MATYNLRALSSRNHWKAETGNRENECAPIFRSIFEPTCISSLQYTVLKISSISYPYQCLFVPSAPKGMGREKILKAPNNNKQKFNSSLYNLEKVQN